MSIERFPDWSKIYEEQEVKEMGWYLNSLDSDLKKELKDRKITSGKFLDLGTGPGTQAHGLAQLGFEVIGTDISKEAIRLAGSKYKDVLFMEDDVLNTTLNSELNLQFDYIFDRGCFHVFAEDLKDSYIESVLQLLKPGGLLFLKCFSDTQPEIGKGPYRFSPADIAKIFGGHFQIEKCVYTDFQREKKPYPKALFVVMRRE